MKPSIRDTMPFYKPRNFTNVLGCSLLKPSAGVAEVSIAAVEATTALEMFGDGWPSLDEVLVFAGGTWVKSCDSVVVAAARLKL